LRTTLSFVPQSGRYRKGLCFFPPPPASEASGGEGSGVGGGATGTEQAWSPYPVRVRFAHCRRAVPLSRIT